MSNDDLSLTRDTPAIAADFVGVKVALSPASAVRGPLALVGVFQLSPAQADALFGGGLPSKNHIHSGQNKIQFRLGQLARSHSQLGLVESHNLRDVRHRFLGKPGRALRKKNVTRRRRPLHVAGQGNTDGSGDSTPVQSITLYDQYRSAKSWLRSARFTKIRPPHLSLGDRHHSLRSSVRRAARDANPSAGSFTSSRTRFIASVTLSGTWRATYSLSAHEYTSLRDRFARCARVSARSKMSLGWKPPSSYPEYNPV
jgi:hypothetical protein